MSDEKNSETTASQSPVFVPGIGPPLRQIEEDYREALPKAGSHGEDPRIYYDALALIQEVYRLRAALGDFADKGLRCDLTPTMRLKDVGQLYMDFSGYLRRADLRTRERAREALNTEDAQASDSEVSS